MKTIKTKTHNSKVVELLNTYFSSINYEEDDSSLYASKNDLF